MKVLVAGGSGLLGREIVRSVLDAGHETVGMSRKRPDGDAGEPRASWVMADVMDPASLSGALSGVDVVVDAVQFPNSPIENPKKGYTFERIDLGGTRNLADAAKAAGVSRFIGISGAGAAEDGPYHWLRCKWLEEQHIKGTGVPHTIFRPSWIYGPRDVSLNRFLGFARYLPFVPVLGNGRTRINPLFVGDLGKHVAAAVGHDEAVNRTFEIGGPQELTMDEVVKTALRVAGKRRFLLHQPARLMKLGAAVLQHVPGRPLTPDAVDFITMDGVVDTEALRETFGLPLTSLEDGLRTYLPR